MRFVIDRAVSWSAVELPWYKELRHELFVRDRT